MKQAIIYDGNVKIRTKILCEMTKVKPREFEPRPYSGIKKFSNSGSFRNIPLPFRHFLNCKFQNSPHAHCSIDTSGEEKAQLYKCVMK